MMDNENSVIYGLEFQARALASQLAETEKIKFIIGTQCLKQTSNQIHILEFNEEISTIKTSVSSFISININFLENICVYWTQ